VARHRHRATLFPCCEGSKLPRVRDLSRRLRFHPRSGAETRRWRALAVTQLAEFMTLLDLGIVNVALPSMERRLGASAGTVQWVVSGYALAAGAVVGAGRPGRRHARPPQVAATVTPSGVLRPRWAWPSEPAYPAWQPSTVRAVRDLFAVEPGRTPGAERGGSASSRAAASAGSRPALDHSTGPRTLRRSDTPFARRAPHLVDQRWRRMSPRHRSGDQVHPRPAVKPRAARAPPATNVANRRADNAATVARGRRLIHRAQAHPPTPASPSFR
jgi:hypothetical protein